MGQLHVRIILCHLFHHASPQSRRIQHICLVHTRHFAFSLARYIKRLDGDSTDFLFGVGQGIDCLTHAVFCRRMALAKIQTAGQLSHNQHVKACPADFFF